MKAEIRGMRQVKQGVRQELQSNAGMKNIREQMLTGQRNEDKQRRYRRTGRMLE